MAESTALQVAPTADTPIYVIGARANALMSLAALAPGLGEAELKVALHLASIEDPVHHSAKASSRQIAGATRLSRSNVQRALDSLNRRRLIAIREGTATRAAAYLLNFTQTTAFRGGPAVGPPPAQMALPGGPAAGPPVWATIPPESDGVASQQGHPFQPVAPVDISIEPISIIDRLLSSRPNHFDKATLAQAEKWVHGYMAKFSPIPNPHPPDPYILAQLLAVADLPTIEWLISELMVERKPPGQTYAWFVTVALQRIHGIQPQVLKARRAALRIARRPQAPEPTQDNLEFAGDLIADLTKAKGM